MRRTRSSHSARLLPRLREKCRAQRDCGGALHPRGDNVVAVGVPCAQAAFELRARGRQDEDADCLRHQVADQPGTLIIDLQQHVVTSGQFVFDGAARGAFQIAVDDRIFEKLAAFDHGHELIVADEEVVDAVDLTRARRARGVGHRQPNRRLAFEQRVDQGGFAGARGRRHDVQAAGHDGFPTRYSGSVRVTVRSAL